MHDLLRAIVLGVVEGVTEFLPISSTGHLVLCERLMGIDLHDPFWSMFTVFIQIGAIAAVVVYFRRRILDLLRGERGGRLTPLEISAAARAAASAAAAAGIAGALGGAPGGAAGPSSGTRTDDVPLTPRQRFYTLLMIALATLPVGLAYFADKWAEQNMADPRIVGLALLLGGVAMIVIEWLRLNETTARIEQVTWKQALVIGSSQVLAAVFPGTSRSAATIMAGLAAGLSRQAAAEFSFFLAIPVMSLACTYKLLKYLARGVPPFHQVLLLIIGTIVSFVVAWGVIAVFMAYIRRHSFVPFAVYRVVLGVVVLWLVRG